MTARVLVSSRRLDPANWLAYRQQGIGSSDAAAVCGLDPYRSPYEVFLEKRGEAPPKPETRAMWLGKQLEPIVANLFTQETGWPVRRRQAILQHRKLPWMLCNLDRRTRDDTGRWVPLELKTTAQWHEADWPAGDCPDAYRVQVAHQLAVDGADHGYLAVLIGGREFRWLRIDRDPELEASLIALESEFWAHVERGEPPPLSGSPAEEALLTRLYPTVARPDPIALPPEVAPYVALYWAAKSERDAAEARMEAAATQLKAALRDAAEAWWDGPDGTWRVTWKPVTRRGLDTRRLEQEHPEWAVLYTTEETTRRFRVLPPKRQRKEG